MTLEEAIRYYEDIYKWLLELKHLRNLAEYSRDFKCTIEEAEEALTVEKSEDDCE